MGDGTFAMLDYMPSDTAASIHLPKRKEFPRWPRDPAVSDIPAGIVAQVKREVGEALFYITRDE